jgi:hypothetical protein
MGKRCRCVPAVADCFGCFFCPLVYAPLNTFDQFDIRLVLIHADAPGCLGGSAMGLSVTGA